MSFATDQPALLSSSPGRSFGLPVLATAYCVEAICLLSSAWFVAVASAMQSLVGGGAETLERAHVALIVTWADGSFDTTSGFQHFGARMVLPTIVFALAGCGLWMRREWGYWLALVLGWIGVLEPITRLVAIKQFIPYSDSLGYQLDVQMAHMAIVVASIPAGIAVWFLMLPSTRILFGKASADWRQFTLSAIGLAITVSAVLLKHVLSLAAIYGHR